MHAKKLPGAKVLVQWQPKFAKQGTLGVQVWATPMLPTTHNSPKPVTGFIVEQDPSSKFEMQLEPSAIEHVPLHGVVPHAAMTPVLPLLV
jgi:hypothetical protein